VLPSPFISGKDALTFALDGVNPMAAYYTVVQYVPDPVIDERINLGVIVYDDVRSRSRFINDWKRVQVFGDRDVTFLKECLSEITEAMEATEGPPFGRAEVERVASSWVNSIQFTPPRGSLDDVDELLDDVGNRFLREPKPRRKRARDRRAAVRIARDAISKALKRRGIVRTEDHIAKGLSLAGKVESHQFEIGIRNGTLRAAADALSFEGNDDDTMTRDLKSTAWSFGDVHTLFPGLGLSVVILTKDRTSSIFQRAANIFERLDAEIVTEDRVGEWADRLAEMSVH
jgi:hypothetical protein